MNNSTNTKITQSASEKDHDPPEGEKPFSKHIIKNSQQVPLSSILVKLKGYLQETYLEKLDKVILFGSQARGDAKEDSDIDILIVLNDDFNDYQETNRISYFISELCLEYDIVMNCFLTSLEKWKTKNNGFFRNIRKEGIIL
jgi:predicted nucleotidyltransferase